jgi:ABC-2 type transport system permease protein
MRDPSGCASWPSASRLIASQLRYHLVLMARSPRAVFAGVLLPAIILAMRGGTAGGSTGDGTDLVAGLAVVGALSASYVTHATSLVLARESGVLRRWRLSPLPAWCFFAGKTLATLALSAACAVATVVVAALMGTWSSPGRVALMIAPIAIGVVCWASVATAVSSLIPGGGAAYPLLTITYLPVALLSGAVGQPAHQSAWLRTATDLLPVRPILTAVAGVLRNGRLEIPLHSAAVLACWTGVSLLATRLVFRWTPRPVRSLGSGADRPVGKRCGKGAGVQLETLHVDEAEAG